MKISSIWDNKGESYDRYTVIFENIDRELELNHCLSVSSDPDSIQGYSNFSYGLAGDHLGERVTFEALPEDIQKHIGRRINGGY